ncbi:hypothetical protein K501DRAFT_241677 [Backusella circina FSU 941]|nr:hypothetical protein K501DRAFT_241677 [Backusella circina FSU 941]
MTKYHIVFGFVYVLLHGLHAQPNDVNTYWGISSSLSSFMDPAFISQKTGCPVFQLSCPECPSGSECVYPDLHGCPGAGMPFCKKIKECQGVTCRKSHGDCPMHCRIFCDFSEDTCCPFDKEPVCAPVCNTFAPCKVTACPKECPNDCFYPDANYCCPKSGKTVCRK